mgnify:CR=1 FL=1
MIRSGEWIAAILWHRNLLFQFIPLLEPYVSYLASLQMPGREDTFLQVFSDFCDKE